MSKEEIATELINFIRERFLDGDPKKELTETTPLLAWGILDSLNTAVLLTYIRDEMNVVVQPAKVNARTFKDVQSISSMICELTATVTG